MPKYKFYEKVRDKYVVQNKDSLEIELVDKQLYIEGIELGLIENYDIKSDLTRKLISKEYMLFECDKYYIVYDRIENKCILYVISSIRRENLYIYIPSVFDKIYMRNTNSVYKETVYIVCNNIKHLECIVNGAVLDLYYLNTLNINDMSNMFSYSTLESIKWYDFDTSNVKDMSRMFSHCFYITELDLSTFDTSKVTNMAFMFDNCTNLRHLDLSSFDTSNVMYMNNMFDGCSILESIQLSNFNTQNVIDFSEMFSECSKLVDIDVSNFR